MLASLLTTSASLATSRQHLRRRCQVSIDRSRIICSAGTVKLREAWQPLKAQHARYFLLRPPQMRDIFRRTAWGLLERKLQTCLIENSPSARPQFRNPESTHREYQQSNAYRWLWSTMIFFGCTARCALLVERVLLLCCDWSNETNTVNKQQKYVGTRGVHRLPLSGFTQFKRK